MLWPTGVLQDEMDVAGNQATDFSRDGPPWKFLSDAICMGWRTIRVCLRHSRGRGCRTLGRAGRRNIARPMEWVKIDRNAIRDREGAPPLSLRSLERQGGEVDLAFVGQNPHPPAKSAGRMGTRFSVSVLWSLWKKPSISTRAADGRGSSGRWGCLSERIFPHQSAVSGIQSD